MCVRACVCVCISDLSYWSSPSKFTCVYYRSGYWYFYCKHLTMIFIFGSLQVTILGTFLLSVEKPNRSSSVLRVFITHYLQNNTQGFDLVSADSRHTQISLLPILKGTAQLCHRSLLNHPPKRNEGKEKGGRKLKCVFPKAAAPVPVLSSFLKPFWNACYVKAHAPRTEDAEH